MPAVALWVGNAFLAGIGFAGVTASIATVMTVGAAVMTLAVASVRRASKLKDAGAISTPTGMSVMVRETEVPANIVFGEALVGGVVAYLNSTGTELRSLYWEIIHTAHEVDSFIGWYIDDKYIPIADVDGINGEGVAAGSNDGRVALNSGGHGLDPYSSTPVLYLRGHLGTDSQAVDSMLDTAFSDIDTNHRHRGCARSVVRCELVQGGESKWNGRPPGQITAVVRGAKCYDPRADGTFAGGVGAHRLATPSTWTWTDNPALHWARYRTMAAPLGPGWGTDRIDWQSVFDAANVCDALVAVPTAATEKRFRCDLVVNTLMEPHEVITKILATMGGKERQFNGLWHVYAASWPSTDFALTDDDLIGEVQYRKQPDIAERYNQVKPSFVDRNRIWKRVQGIAVNNTTLRANRDNARVLPVVLDLDGVTREYQAQRLALHALNHADDTGILVFPTGYNGLNIRPGDTGTVTLSEWGFAAKTFRCVKATFVEFEGAELVLKEDSSGNYSDPIEASYSTRTAAGDIVFGTVLPWYLEGPPVIGWVADSQGLPAGVRGVEGIADRSQLLLNNATMVILATPDTTVAYGLPAVPIYDGRTYRIRVKHNSQAPSATGYYIRMNELATGLPSGKTHVGYSDGEAVVELRDSSVDLVTNGPYPVLSIDEYLYTPTAGTQCASLSFYNYGAASPSQIYIEWVGMTEVGRNVDLLPGVTAQTDTAGIVPEGASAHVVTEDSSDVNLAVLFGGAYGTVASASFTVPTGESYRLSIELQAWYVTGIGASGGDAKMLVNSVQVQDTQGIGSSGSSENTTSNWTHVDTFAAGTHQFDIQARCTSGGITKLYATVKITGHKR